MNTSSMPTTEPASEESPIIQYATPNDVYASLRGGGCVSVEEFPRGEILDAAKLAEARMEGENSSYDAPFVILLGKDVDGSAIDTVWFHPDQDDRLEAMQRARAALDAAEAALRACGYADNAHLRSA